MQELQDKPTDSFEKVTELIARFCSNESAAVLNKFMTELTANKQMRDELVLQKPTETQKNIKDNLVENGLILKPLNKMQKFTQNA